MFFTYLYGFVFTLRTQRIFTGTNSQLRSLKGTIRRDSMPSVIYSVFMYVPARFVPSVEQDLIYSSASHSCDISNAVGQIN